MTTSQNALVIGGLGFIGVNLTTRLTALGSRVTVLTTSIARHAAQAPDLIRAGVQIVEGDLRDLVLISKLVAGQDVVFNLSGQAGAVKSMEDPWTDLDMNLRGALVLLESIRGVNPAAKVVVAGSRLQYGHAINLPVGEDARQEPLCLHGIHKRTVEQYLRLYSRLYGIRCAMARVTNPYGPGQLPGRTTYGVINRLIQLALADQPLTIYGDGAQLRDYVHVDDVVSALIVMADSPRADGRAYNVGSGTGTSLGDVARAVIRIAAGGRIERVEWPELAAKIETGDFIADVSRIRADLGWAPTISLEDGLTRTVASYRSHAAL